MRDRTHSTVILLAAANVCGHGEGGPRLGIYDEGAFIGPESAVEVAHGLCGAAWMGTGGGMSISGRSCGSKHKGEFEENSYRWQSRQTRWHPESSQRGCWLLERWGRARAPRGSVLRDRLWALA